MIYLFLSLFILKWRSNKIIQIDTFFFIYFAFQTYNLGMPAFSRNADPGCDHRMMKAVSFGIDTNFLVAILVCIAILLILLLAVVVHKRKSDDLYKDLDDIRENIINYDDEGGGEVDTGYDLNVLRAMYDDNPSLDSKINPIGLQGRGMYVALFPILKTSNEINVQILFFFFFFFFFFSASAPSQVPDICGFLDGRKESCDKDPDTNPFDDVRHYAYEGEGNSDGSLSSLASCKLTLFTNYLILISMRFPIDE